MRFASAALSASSALLLCAGLASAQTYQGYWEPPFDHDLAGFTIPPPGDEFVSVHMALIPKGPNRGKVLVWDRHDNQPKGSWIQRWSVADVAVTPPVFQNGNLTLPSAKGDLFCAGHTWTCDGDLFVTGGTTFYREHHEDFRGGVLTYIYEPDLGSMGEWIRMQDSKEARWYPTTTVLGNDQIINAGGTDDGYVDNYEVFDPHARTWLTFNGSRLLDGPPRPYTRFGWYPRLFLLSSGQVFLAGMWGVSARLDHENAPGVWELMDDGEYFRYVYNTAVLVPNLEPRYEDAVLRLGGDAFDVGAIGYGPTNVVEYCAAGAAAAPAWNWKKAPPLRRGRMHANAVVLPDGSLLVIGGRLNSSDVFPGLFTRVPELLHPEVGVWQDQPNAASPRDYHSTAALLPDGRVISAGGEAALWDYQVFVPHYLADGLPRPVLHPLASEDMGYGQVCTFQHDVMPAGTKVQKAVLVRPASITHHTDFDARYVALKVLGQDSGSITVVTPSGSRRAPRGYYMLFLVSNQGVPSEAGWVRLQ
ncbi:MAG: DUF1929 domain-containing protein [Planctomycetota bacterium]|nr:MAG: DUF1929 domain-containing protein [Planctomycetota bacterium]